MNLVSLASLSLNPIPYPVPIAAIIKRISPRIDAKPMETFLSTVLTLPGFSTVFVVVSGSALFVVVAVAVAVFVGATVEPLVGSGAVLR